MNCIICNNNRLELVKKSVRDHKDISVKMCVNCQHQQLDLLPSLEHLQEYYDQDRQAKSVYTNIDIEVSKSKSHFDITRRINLVQKYIENKEKAKVLEIGTGYGFFIKEMEMEGYQIEGIEISQSRRDIARDICNSSIYHYNLLKEVPQEMVGKYDIIVMFQVLEHIPDPNLFLKNVRNLLKNEGKVIIEVPNLNDHLLGISKEYFDFFYQEAHISYFAPKSLEVLLNQCGYKNTEVNGSQRYSLENMMNWLLNKKPQIDKPIFESIEDLKWLDEYYKNKLANELKTDTIVAIANK